MQKQLGLIIGAAVLLLVLVGGVVWWQAGQNKTESNQDTQNGQQGTSFATPKDACNYLTQQVAVQLLGEGAEKGTVAPPASTNDVSVSTCTYSSKVGDSLADIKNMRTATLLVRSPLTATGAVSNDEPFDTVKTGAIRVEGYGEKAFWDPELGQLNVLKGGAWLIMSLGKSAIGDKTLDEAKQLADKIVPQF